MYLILSKCTIWSILRYKFGIVTGDSKPVCCSQPRYSVHKSKNIVTQIETLLHNSHIRHWKTSNGTLIVLAAKLHQETVVNIKIFLANVCFL